MKNLLSGCILLILIPVLTLCFCNGAKELRLRTENQQRILTYLLYQNSAADCLTEALKAEAILFRSELYDYTDEDWRRLLQKGVEIEQEEDYIKRYDTLQKAVEETDGMVVSCEGRRIRSVYHKASAGKTRDGKQIESAQYAYLTAVDSPWDLSAPGAYQSFSFSEKYLLNSFFRNEGAVHMEITKTDETGYVQEVLWGSQRISGDQVREYLGLSSSCFMIEHKNNMWIFTCQGIGHGLGVSLYGCQILAEQGKTYAEILKYYCPAYDIMQL